MFLLCVLLLFFKSYVSFYSYSNTAIWQFLSFKEWHYFIRLQLHVMSHGTAVKNLHYIIISLKFVMLQRKRFSDDTGGSFQKMPNIHLLMENFTIATMTHVSNLFNRSVLCASLCVLCFYRVMCLNERVDRNLCSWDYCAECWYRKWTTSLCPIRLMNLTAMWYNAQCGYFVLKLHHLSTCPQMMYYSFWPKSWSPLNVLVKTSLSYLLGIQCITRECGVWATFII